MTASIIPINKQLDSICLLNTIIKIVNIIAVIVLIVLYIFLLLGLTIGLFSVSAGAYLNIKYTQIIDIIILTINGIVTFNTIIVEEELNNIDNEGLGYDYLNYDFIKKISRKLIKKKYIEYETKKSRGIKCN